MATIYNIDIEGFISCFWDFFGGQLDTFQNDIELSELELSIDPTGISLEGTLAVNGYQAAQATIAVDREGFSIIGTVSDVKFGDLTIKNPSLDVFIGGGLVQKASRRPLQFAIKGTVDFKNIEIDVSVYMSKDDNNALLFTIYGEYNLAVSSGSLAPELQGSFLDLPMKQVALLAGNTNTGAPGFVNKYGYPLIKGEHETSKFQVLR
jgi:hypothetical protein